MINTLIRDFIMCVYDRNDGNMYGNNMKILLQFRDHAVSHMLIFRLWWHWWCIVWFIWKVLYCRHSLLVMVRKFSAEFTTALSNQRIRQDISQMIWKILHQCHKSININMWDTAWSLNCSNIFTLFPCIFPSFRS